MRDPEYQLIHRFLTPKDISELLKYTDCLVEEDFDIGRLGTKYEKVNITHRKDSHLEQLTDLARRTLTSRTIKEWDAWLLCMPDGSWIPPHVDLSPSGEHKRLNACIQASNRGGVFGIEGRQVVIDPGVAIIFRPDILRHEVSMTVGRPRWMLSVGVTV